MKKFIITLLSIAMLINIAAVDVSFADSVSGENQNKLDFRAEILTDLGVFGEKPSEDVCNSVISRYDFAKYLAALIGVRDVNLTDKKYFTDVDDICIDNLVSLGIVRGNGDNSFYPERSVSAAEAVTMSLRALGYREYAEKRGNGIYSYMQIASRLNISVPNGDTLTVNDMIYLMYDLLDISMMDVLSVIVNDGEEEYKYSDKGTAEFLDYWRNLKLVEGQLTGSFLASIGSITDIRRNQIAIDETLYDCSSEDAFKLIGKNVAAIYDNKSEKLLNVVADTDTTDVFVLYAQDIVKFSDDALEYQRTNDEKSKKIKFDVKNLSVIYNGKVAAGGYEELFDFELGTVSLYALNGKDYTVAVIEEFVDVKVMQYGTDNLTLYTDHDGDLAELKFDEFEDINTYKRIFSANSELTIAPKSFTEGDVISACVSEDKTYMVLYVCTEKVTGTVTEISTDENTNQKVLKINTAEYKLSPYYKDLDIYVGRAGEFILDKFGYIAGMRQFRETEENLAYLYDIAEISTGFDSKISVKLYTEDKCHVIYMLAENVVYNSQKMKASDVYAELRKSGKLSKGLIKYTLNSDGNIRYMDSGSGNTYFREMTDGVESLKIDGEFFGDRRQYILRPKAAVFMVPAEGTEVIPENFNIVEYVGDNSVVFRSGGDYRLYNDDQDFFADYAVYFYDSDYISAGGESSIHMMVDSIVASVGPDGGEVREIIGYSNLLPFRITVTDDVKVRSTVVSEKTPGGFAAVEEGDWILCQMNPSGQADNITIMYNADCDPFDQNHPDAYTPYKAWGGFSGYNYHDWDILKVERGVPGGKTALLVLGEKETGTVREVLSLDEKTTQMMVYDSAKRNNKVYVGTIDDIESYDSTNGEKCDRICYYERDVSRITYIALYKY